MAQETPNPFVLPGFGQQGESAGNPLFAGLDMMRQAWQNLAGHMDAPAMPVMSLDELDRRIRELQTVQNWLQLNATMLTNTIQGLEIQRSTLKTLQSFSGGAFPGAAAASAKSGKSAAAKSAAGAQADAAGQAYAQAAGDWWNLVQQQFEQLREATTASLGGMAEAAETAASAGAAKKPARSRATPAKAATRAKTSRASTAAKTSRKTRT